VLVCAILVLASRCTGDEWIVFSTAKVRAMALGGAYFSAEDDLFSAQWNPASFGSPGRLRHRRIRIVLSPATTILALNALRTRNSSWNRDDRLSEREAIFSALWGVKAVSIEWRNWNLAFVNTDEPLRQRADGESAIGGWNGVTGHTYTLALAFKLAPEVTIGASVTREERSDGIAEQGWGGSFGILVRPSRYLNAGLTYVSRPEGLSELDEDLERIDRGTVNGGISVYPWTGMVLLLDLRNLDNSGSKFGSAEPHVGIEQTIRGIMSLRAGWHRVIESKGNVVTCGFGVKPFWRTAPSRRSGRQLDFVSYTFIWQQKGAGRWHMLAVNIPFDL